MSISPDIVAELNTLACDFYRGQLAPSGEAARYARSRGLSEATIEHWQLGYAPNSKTALMNYLSEVGGWPTATIVQSGLAYTGEWGAVDAFRNRLVFPILDRDGKKVLAFSTRQLADDGSPKYLNSSDTPLFAKRETFYGWPNTADIAKRGEAYVVEGNVDMLALWNAGVRNVVAVCGTALTDEHLALLAEICSRVTLVLDADAAGQKATRRSLLLPGAGRLNMGVVTVTGGKDPADLMASEGVEGWHGLIAARIDRWEWLWRTAREPFAVALDADLSAPGAADARLEAAVGFKNDWGSLVAEYAAPDRVRPEMERLAGELGLPANMLLSEFAGAVARSAATDRGGDEDEMMLVALADDWAAAAPVAAFLPLHTATGRRLRDAWISAGEAKPSAQQRAMLADRTREVADVRSALGRNYALTNALSAKRKELLNAGRTDEAALVRRALDWLSGPIG